MFVMAHSWTLIARPLLVFADLASVTLLFKFLSIHFDFRSDARMLPYFDEQNAFLISLSIPSID